MHKSKKLLKINSPQVVFSLLNKLKKSKVEEFWVVALDSNQMYIDQKMLFRGSLDSCTIYPAEIFRYALLKKAKYLIVAHNHPNQILVASKEDIQTTSTLIEIGFLLDIHLLDHLVLTDKNYLSLASAEFFKNKNEVLKKLTDFHQCLNCRTLHVVEVDQ